MKIVIFDLDGTISLIDKRRAKATKNGKFNWEVFFKPENISLDEPNVSVIEVLKTLKSAGNRIYIFSGRSAISIKETKDWLSNNGVEYDLIKMRPLNDYTPDDELKLNWLNELIPNKEDILCIFDDRDKVVKMWRENGLNCFQVNYGNF